MNNLMPTRPTPPPSRLIKEGVGLVNHSEINAWNAAHGLPVEEGPSLFYRLGQWPIGYLIERVLILFAAAIFALVFSGCTTTPTPAPEPPLTIHDANTARAQALEKIGVSGDPETKRLAIFALVTMGQGAPAAPPPQPIIAGNRSVGDAIFGFLDRTLERAINVAPAYLAYRGQVRGAETTERIAAINRDVSLNQSNNFMALGIAGITGTQNVGIAGVNALATVAATPPPPTTNISGNTGPVLVGGGNLNHASQNPVNPAPVVCTTGTATTPGTCSRGP